jgi:ATP-binding cassette subfamily F protein uup
MDNVVTSTMVFEGAGIIKEYVGGYSQWVAKGGRLHSFAEATAENPKPGNSDSVKNTSSSSQTKSIKLSYKLQRELEQQPGLIEKMEHKQLALEAAISKPDFYLQESDKVQQTLKELAQTQALLEKSYQRWEALEKMKEGSV